jgi:hypothetical protein
LHDFVYIGGTVIEDAVTEQDIRRGISSACGVMQNINRIGKQGIYE